MNALAELRKRTRTAANPANPANQGRNQVADSQDSQGVDSKSGIFATPADALKAERTRLLALADRLGIDPAHVHRMTDADLVLWRMVPADALRSYLLALDDTATRQAGKVPLDDTARMYCQHCGPVWTHPDIAVVLPMVDGWPRALGCPWCAVRKAGGYIPRPKVACENCQHFTPDAINPQAGMGNCTQGHGTFYPMQGHRCADFRLGKNEDLA